MSGRAEYLQLAPGDDVNSVRDRLSFIRGKRVLLIWPESGTALTRKLDLVLVQREARRRAIQLALVTHDAQVVQHAAELGISTFETIGDSERQRWRRGRTRVFTLRHHKPEDEPDPETLMDVASRVRSNQAKPSSLRLLIERTLILLALMGAILAIAYVVMPSASLTLTLARQSLSVQTILTADPDLSEVDVENRLIPATRLRATVQASGTLPTTGQQSLGDRAAMGIVVFSNKTDQPVEIPANTSLSTSAGSPILFKTIAPATLPGGVDQRVEVAIEALPASAGDSGNVDAGLINTILGPLDAFASVINLTPTAGGETRTFASVTEDDRERLLAIVRAQLQALAYDEMRANLNPSQLIIIETIRIIEERSDWTTYSHNVGDLSESLSLEMRAVVETLMIDDRFGRQIIFAQLSAQKPANLALRADTFTYERGPVSAVDPQGQVSFSASGEVLAIGDINAEALRASLAGRPLSEAGLLIVQNANLAPDVAPQIVINPSWLSHMPLLPFRIQVSIQEQP